MRRSPAVTGAIPAGIVRSGIAELCPPPDRVLGPDDRLVLLAEDHGSERVADAPAPVDAGAIVPPSDSPGAPERTLVIGWNRRAAVVIRELDAYVAPGSEVVAVSGLDRVLPETGEITGLANLTLTGRMANTTSRPVLDGLDIQSFDHVIVLCESDDRDPDIADARILLTLLHLRDIGSTVRAPASPSCPRCSTSGTASSPKWPGRRLHRQLAAALPAARADRGDPGPGGCLPRPVRRRGAEIYLRDAASYVEPGRDVSFATVQASAQGRGEVALGYRLASRAADAAVAYGIVLNPARDARVVFGPGDKVVVLAEA